MYRNTRFSELMKGLPRGTFEKIIQEHQVDKHNKGFRSWDQLMAMIYGQLSGSKSLRELEVGFNNQAVHHYHLGTRAIKRSTLADANSKRSSEAFAAVCGHLLSQAHRKVKNDIKELLYLIDSTPIPLKGLGYNEWTQGNHNHRTHGLKVHTVIEPNAAVPVYVEMTPPNVNDIDIGKKLSLEQGATYVFDKGYCDYNWWYKINQKQAKFVTRFKKNAGIEQVRQRRIPKKSQGVILEDVVVCFKNKHPGGKRINNYHGTRLRKIVVARPGKDTPLLLATNDLKRPAEEIAELYKRRWEIELFFKWIKQNLKIKRFLGRSENAVKIQIYTALITYLLVNLYRKRNGLKLSMQLCVVTLRSGLFQRPEIEQETVRKRRRKRLDALELQTALPLQ